MFDLEQSNWSSKFGSDLNLIHIRMYIFKKNVCLCHLIFTLCENIKGNLHAETLEGTRLISLNYDLTVITSVNTL